LKSEPATTVSLDEHTCPKLARGVRLRLDPITNEPILLFPEGVLPLDDVTYDILRHCTGEASLGSIIESLSEEYEADRDLLRSDVRECLLQLRQQMLVTFAQ
jgi:pyrroloquinoline quinone biosynthesis protein D